MNEIEILKADLLLCKIVLSFVACEGLDDADFHSMDQFELAEGVISMVNRSREALEALSRIKASDTL